jgi:hypothetical protein
MFSMDGLEEYHIYHVLHVLNNSANQMDKIGTSLEVGALLVNGDAKFHLIP